MLKNSVTVLGLGAIGLPVAKAIAAGEVPGLVLHSVSAASRDCAAARLGRDVPVISAHQAGSMGGIVVECLPPQMLAEVAQPVLASGRTMVVASIGGLLRQPALLALADKGPGRLVLPSGALGGLDAVRAIAGHPQAEVRLISSKPVTGFEPSAYLASQGIELDRITTRTTLFDGPAVKGVRLFPRNVNVVAALALAGIGPEKTRLTLRADPALTSNTHRIEAQSPLSRLTVEIANLPDPQNPRSSAITAWSIIASLRNLSRGWRFL